MKCDGYQTHGKTGFPGSYFIVSLIPEHDPTNIALYVILMQWCFGSKHLVQLHLSCLQVSIDGEVALAAAKSEVMVYRS